MHGESWLCVRGKGSIPTLENAKETFWQQEKIYAGKQELQSGLPRRGKDEVLFT